MFTSPCKKDLLYLIVSSIICTVGIIGNIISLVIWYRKRRDSCVSYIFTALSVFDTSALCFYVFFVVYFKGLTGPLQQCPHTEAGMTFVLICFHVYIVSCSLSSWTTILLAGFRYITICHKNIAKNLCTRRATKAAIGIMFLWVQVISIPYYFYYEVDKTKSEDNNSSSFWIYHTNFAQKHYQTYQVILLWLFGISMKLTPCFVLTILSFKIALKLIRVRARMRSKLRTRTDYGRTSFMLIVIVLIYVVTALPIGITAFVTGVRLTEELHFFYFLADVKLSNILNLIQILNCSVNFFVYIGLSKPFRSELRSVFHSYVTLCSNRERSTMV